MESAEVTSTLVETTGATPVSEEITDSTPAPAKALSKRAQKRAARDAEWEAKKEQRKEWTKEKRKQVKELRREKIEQGSFLLKPCSCSHEVKLSPLTANKSPQASSQKNPDVQRTKTPVTYPS